MVKVEIQKCDIPFLCEAIEQRAILLTEMLMGATVESIREDVESIRKDINELKGRTKEEEAPKKPHWTQTPEGKKKLSRKRKGARK